MLGLGKTDSYWILKQRDIETVILYGKIRVVRDSFEKWYANQVKYRKVNGDPPGASLNAASFSVRDIAALLNVNKATITRINNALENLPKHLEESMRKLETLEDQLESAREEVKCPFPQEKELAEKSARLSELNTLLNMDERTSEASMLDDSTTESGAAEQEEEAPSKKKHEEVL